jgi:hypothetical protein
MLTHHTPIERIFAGAKRQRRGKGDPVPDAAATRDPGTDFAVALPGEGDSHVPGRQGVDRPL